MSSIRYLSDLPDPAKEIAKCREFLSEFVDDTIRSYKYMEILQSIANREEKMIVIELDDVVQYKNDHDFVHNIESNTIRYVRYFEDEIDKLMPPPTVEFLNTDVIDNIDNQRLNVLANANNLQNGARIVSDVPASLKRRYEVRFKPLSSNKPVKLREVKADDIGHLVTVKGLVTRISDVKPKVKVCTYTCEICGSENFQDINGSQFMPLLKCGSKRCIDNKTSKLNLQTRGSRFSKSQELRLQELPDQVPVGHIPRSIAVSCSGELVRECAPGDVVTISGVYLAVKYQGFRALTAGLQADTYLEAFSVVRQKPGYSSMMVMRDEEERQILVIARDPDPYGKLAAAIAPEIFGHEDVKKALLLQLVGGVTRQMPDGLRIRGDINICLMGDPGVAKSQLLKYISIIAPRGIYTTGKGSSGVGLTAAVVKDSVTGDLTLEGGALVLADMGICCIDEFDKMEEGDRTAIHEVMEQQTISVAKAGITTTLNARAAVLAAANPLYGRYNPKKSLSENVDLPNSLLSRFDLLFLILDHQHWDRDTALARHVLETHRNPNCDNVGDANRRAESMPPENFKRYIAAAKSIMPIVPKDLSGFIVSSYVDLRKADFNAPVNSRSRRVEENNQAVITPRQLLSILRLSQALARLRLSQTVDRQDVTEAIRLNYASKSSLLTSQNRNESQDDAFSKIFNTIKEVGIKQGNNAVRYVQVENAVLKQGFTAEQLRTCLEEYQSINVLEVDEATGTIIFV